MSRADAFAKMTPFYRISFDIIEGGDTYLLIRINDEALHRIFIELLDEHGFAYFDAQRNQNIGIPSQSVDQDGLRFHYSDEGLVIDFEDEDRAESFCDIFQISEIRKGARIKFNELQDKEVRIDKNLLLAEFEKFKEDEIFHMKDPDLDHPDPAPAPAPAPDPEQPRMENWQEIVTLRYIKNREDPVQSRLQIAFLSPVITNNVYNQFCDDLALELDNGAIYITPPFIEPAADGHLCINFLNNDPRDGKKALHDFCTVFNLSPEHIEVTKDGAQLKFNKLICEERSAITVYPEYQAVVREH